jgi:predicted DCC family thiol-disulfide oxidoreductase YuxK
MTRTVPLLLFDGQCGVCRRIGHWVQKSGESQSDQPSVIVQPIGDDPEALRSLQPDLDIWDAYGTIHLLMPDGSMRLGGEAVAELLRTLHNTKWFAWIFAVGIFGFRPFQVMLNAAYAILAAVRPLFGCESCGTLIWTRPLGWIVKRVRAIFGKRRHQSPTPRVTGMTTRDGFPSGVRRPPQSPATNPRRSRRVGRTTTWGEGSSGHQ